MAVQCTVMSIDDEQLAPPKKSIFTKTDISIGRSRLNDLVLDHAGVSNTHARLRIDLTNGSPKFFVSDLDSTNGTMIGTKRLDPRVETQIPDRDRIMIAGYIVKVELVADSSAHAEGQNGSASSTKIVPPTDTVEQRVETQTASFPVPENIRVQEIETPPIKPEPVLSTLSSEENVSDELDLSVPSFGSEASLKIHDEDIELDFVATQLLKLSGTILHGDSPLSGIVVIEPSLGQATTDANGYFEFNDILEGTEYSLTVDKKGFIFDSAELNGSLVDQSKSIKIKAKKLFVISGRITHKGKALEGVLIDGGTLGTVLTDETGAYRFTDVPEGTEYLLKATKDGYTFGTVRKVV